MREPVLLRHGTIRQFDQIPNWYTIQFDVYDALTSNEPYRAAWAKEKTLTHIKSLSGVQFVPKIIGAFLKMIE